MKRTTRWTSIACSTLLAVSLLTPATAWAADVNSVYDQLQAQYPAKVTEFTKAGISETQLRTFLDNVLSALKNDSSVTDSNFDSMLINKAITVAGQDADLQSKLTASLSLEEGMQLLGGQLPTSWIGMRNVLKAEWSAGSTGGTTPSVPTLPPAVPPTGSVPPGAPAPGTTPPAPAEEQGLFESKQENGRLVANVLTDRVLADWAEQKPLRLELGSTTNTEIKLPKDLLVKGKEAKQTLEVSVGEFGFKLNLAQLPASDVSVDLKVLSELDVRAQLGQKKLHSYGKPVSVKLSSNENGTKQALQPTGNLYMETQIEVPDGFLLHKHGAYQILANGQVLPLPITEKQVGEERVAVIHHLNGGTFVLASHESRPDFADTSNNWSRANIELLAEKNILSGYADGSFGPAQKVSRAELVTMITRSLGMFVEGEAMNRFTDIKNEAWYNASVTAAVNAKLIAGDPDGRFRPNDHITRQEVAIIFGNALTFLENRVGAGADTPFADLAFKDKQHVATWAQGAVTKVYDYKIMNGYQDSTFQPKAFTTRAEVAAMLVNLLEQAELLSK